MTAIDTTIRESVSSPTSATTPPGTSPEWSAARKLAFRFVFVYTALFCLALSQISFVFFGVLTGFLPERLALWQLGLLAPVLEALGRNVFGVDAVLTNSGSGDQAAFWILWLLIAVVAVVATIIWSVVDRRRRDYSRLWAWTMLVIRFALGGQMLDYGFAKLIPTQMPQPPLATLLEPYGDFSPASVLWMQVGSSPVYEMLLGSVEVLGGLLLFWSRTAILGALVSFVAMVQVFILNMTFDVPVKILSFHLVLFSLILLAPYARNMVELFVFGRSATPFTVPALFTRDHLNRWAAVAQVVVGIWVAIGAATSSWSDYREHGGGAPKPELYGIWSVQDFRVDGRALPPLTTDDQRWQRIVLDSGGATTLQMMDGALVPVSAEVDGSSLLVEEPPAVLDIGRPDYGTLVLSGDLDGTPTVIVAHRMDHDAMTLRSRGFNWVQDEPYFR
ncbi:DoxX family protein [Gordonia metallireducens]|uniref:DoxX family protein n=1 Tax=Gordonia metallireducens TaxID=2897779 RepID=UPI001E622CF1|nr:DoxX family protein [Gordonia metallireducens]